MILNSIQMDTERGFLEGEFCEYQRNYEDAQEELIKCMYKDTTTNNQPIKKYEFCLELVILCIEVLWLDIMLALLFSNSLTSQNSSLRAIGLLSLGLLYLSSLSINFYLLTKDKFYFNIREGNSMKQIFQQVKNPSNFQFAFLHLYEYKKNEIHQKRQLARMIVDCTLIDESGNLISSFQQRELEYQLQYNCSYRVHDMESLRKLVHLFLQFKKQHPCEAYQRHQVNFKFKKQQFEDNYPKKNKICIEKIITIILSFLMISFLYHIVTNLIRSSYVIKLKKKIKL